MPSLLKVITFDVTGTILKLRVPVGQQYAKIGSKYNVQVHPDELTKTFKSVYNEMLVKHPNFGVSDIGWKNWWSKLVHNIFVQCATGIELTTLEKISSDLIELYKTKECWELADDAQYLLEKLNSKFIKLGVISNYDPRLEDILKDLNIHKYFKFIVTSYCAKYEKPSPKIFEIVESINADVKKDEFLHIGDNPKLDYEGASNVGWKALLVTGENNNLLSGTNKEWVVHSLSRVCQNLTEKGVI